MIMVIDRFMLKVESPEQDVDFSRSNHCFCIPYHHHILQEQKEEENKENESSEDDIVSSF